MKNFLPKNKIASEKKTREVYLHIAKQLGCDGELKQIFDKYDALLRGCTNETESNHMKLLAISEINKLMETQYNLFYEGMNNIPIIK